MVVRHRYYRNGEPSEGSTLHAPYLRPATTLMDAVKRRMQMGNLQQLAQRYVTEDGAVLTAISRFGQDEIRIDVPVTIKPKGGKRMREYCVWRPDRAIYASLPMDGFERQNPVLNRAKSRIYARAGSYPDQEVVIFDAALAEIGRIPMDVSGAYITEIGVDLAAGRFVEIGSARLAYWESDEQSSSSASLPELQATAGFYSVDTHSPYTSALTTDAGVFSVAVVDTRTFSVAFKKNTTGDGNAACGGMGYSDVGGAFVWWMTGQGVPTDKEVRFSAAFPGTRTQTLPPKLAIPYRYSAGRGRVVVQNNGTPWIQYATSYNDGVDKEARCGLARLENGAWKDVPLPGLTDHFGTTQGWPFPSLIAHDKATDAVVVGLLDASGVWVFNARDCMGIPIAPFFYKLQGAPNGYSDPENTNWSISMIHDGTMLCWFGKDGITTIGRFEIGRLKQTKLSEEIAGE